MANKPLYDQISFFLIKKAKKDARKYEGNIA